MEFLLIIAVIALVSVTYSRVSDLQKRVEHIERYLAEKTGESAATPERIRDEVHAGTPERSVAGHMAATERPAHASPSDDESRKVEKRFPSTFDDQIRYMTEERSMGEHIHEDPRGSLREAPVTSNTQGRVAEEPTDQFDVFGPFLAWLKEDWLMKLGGFFLILGVGWFVSYAFAHDWVTPPGRIALGLVFGAAVLGFGAYRMRAVRTQGAILLFVGASIAVLTLYADQQFYHLFPSLVSLGVMFMASALLSVYAVRCSYVPLAYANVLLVTVAPALLGTTISAQAMGVYLFVMSAGAIAITVLTAWHQFAPIALFIVAFHMASYVTVPGESDAGLFLANLFGVVFLGTTVLALSRTRSTISDLFTVVGIGLYLVYWVTQAADPAWQSSMLTVWSLLFAGGAWLALRFGASSAHFFAFLGVGASMLGIATAIELEGPALTIAYIVETAILFFGGSVITRKVEYVPLLALPMLVPFLLAQESLAALEWRTGIWHDHAVVVAFMLCSVAGGAAYLARLMRSERDARRYGLLRFMSTIFGVVSGYLGASLHWRIVQGLTGGYEDIAIWLWAMLFVAVACVLVLVRVGTGTGLAFLYTGLGWALVTPGMDPGTSAHTMALALASTAILILGFALVRRASLLPLLVLPLLIPILLSFSSMVAPEWRTGAVHAPAGVLLMLLCAFTCIAAYFAWKREQVPETERPMLDVVRDGALVCLGAYSVVFLWLEVHGLLHMAAQERSGTILWSLLVAVLISAATYARIRPPLILALTFGGLGVLAVSPGISVDSVTVGIAHTIISVTALYAVLTLWSQQLTMVRTLAFLMVPPVFLSLPSFFEWPVRAWYADAWLLGLIGIGFGIIGGYANVCRKRSDEASWFTLAHLSYVGWWMSGIYAARFVWLFMHALVLDQDVATMLTLFMYTMLASVWYVLARLRHSMWRKVASLALLGFVCLRLLVVDVWQMEIVGRFVTFSVIGSVLILVAWLERNARSASSSADPHIDTAPHNK